jgi:hypothetical protein
MSMQNLVQALYARFRVRPTVHQFLKLQHSGRPKKDRPAAVPNKRDLGKSCWQLSMLRIASKGNC